MSKGKTLPTSPSKKLTKKEYILKCHLNSPQMTASEIAERAHAQKSFVEKRLADELERLKRLLGLESGLKVVWVPVSGGGLSGEVKGNMIYVYECEMDGALQTLRHELVDYLITSKIVEPLVGLVNMLIKSREAEIYREKEKLVEIFSKLLFNR